MTASSELNANLDCSALDPYFTLHRLAEEALTRAELKHCQIISARGAMGAYLLLRVFENDIVPAEDRGQDD
jgi:hypothetical protein